MTMLKLTDPDHNPVLISTDAIFYGGEHQIGPGESEPLTELRMMNDRQVFVLETLDQITHMANGTCRRSGRLR